MKQGQRGAVSGGLNGPWAAELTRNELRRALVDLPADKPEMSLAWLHSAGRLKQNYRVVITPITRKVKGQK
jgi:hypothetical protein